MQNSVTLEMKPARNGSPLWDKSLRLTSVSPVAPVEEELCSEAVLVECTNYRA